MRTERTAGRERVANNIRTRTRRAARANNEIENMTTQWVLFGCPETEREGEWESEKTSRTGVVRTSGCLGRGLFLYTVRLPICICICLQNANIVNAV